MSDKTITAMLPEPSPSVLVLPHTDTDPLGILGDALSATGVVPRCVRAFDGEPAPLDMEDAAGLIVLGGSMNVSEQERFPFLIDEMRLIARALERGRPILGICLGSQMVAHVLGAEVRQGERLEVGWHPVTVTEPGDPFFQGFPPVFTAFHWHGDCHVLPTGGALLASSELTPCQAFRYGEGVCGVQFHLEVTEAVLRDWVGSGHADMADAGTTPEAILSGITTYLPRQQRLGLLAFQRWAQQARSAAER